MGGDGRKTDSVEKRHWYTNDGVAWFLVLSFVSVYAAGSSGYLDLSAPPQEARIAFVMAFGTAVVWVFGAEAIREWRGD